MLPFNAAPLHLFLFIADKGGHPYERKDETEERAFDEAEENGLEDVPEGQRQIDGLDSGKECRQRKHGAKDGVNGEEDQHEWHIEQINQIGRDNGQDAEKLNNRGE